MKNDKTMTWTPFVLLFLGLWLTIFHANFEYRHQAMIISDVTTGVLVIILSFVTFATKKAWPRWLICCLGIWLPLAPMFFWSKSPAGYLNDTLMGILLISFSILIPRVGDQIEGYSERPPNWSYNPSAWPQRISILFFAIIAWFITQHFESFQLGYISHVIDPFFKEGTMHILSSNISHLFPAPDAGLGSFAYLIESLMLCKGDASRWRTMPWLVLSFGVLVIPLGLTSIFLLILQPLVIKTWCTGCIVTAACMLIMASLTIDEVLASLEFLYLSKKRGNSFWKTLWLGGESPEAVKEESLITKPFYQRLRYAFKGVVPSWNLILLVLVGLWSIFIPYINQQGSFVHFILAPLVISISIISMAEIVRILKYLNIAVTIALFIILWIFSPFPESVNWMNFCVFFLIIFLSFFGGKRKERYGIWSYKRSEKV